MKYAVNHHDNFVNVYAAFAMGFCHALISLIVEINVMIILTSMKEVMGVIMKYVSLAAIANIPRFYFGALREHKLLACNGKVIEVMNFRHENKLKDAHWSIKILRVIYKIFRMMFGSISYYFMPFTAIFINIRFMVDNTVATPTGK